MTTIKSSAELSRCRTYRYALWRIWDQTKPYALFICLNPSTADESEDDPTLRRCIDFAQSWDYGGVCIGNLFAFRATKPRDLMSAKHPIGEENDRWLSKLSEEAEIIIASWGNHGTYRNRCDDVLETLPDAHYLKLNKSGQPSHPLYLRRDSTPIPF